MSDLADLCDAVARQAMSGLSTVGSLRLVGVDPLTLSVPPLRELPASRVQMQYGLDDVRMADVTLWRSELGGAVPAKDAVLDVDAGPQAGEWRVLGIESQDDVCVVVRLRRSVHVSTTATGAREVRR